MVDDELAGEGGHRELSGTASYKDKAKITNDTYGLGSQPSHANTYAHSLEQYTPLRRGKCFSRLRQYFNSAIYAYTYAGVFSNHYRPIDQDPDNGMEAHETEKPTTL